MNSFVQSQSFGLKHQFGVYAMGAAKRYPLLPTNYADMVAAAREKMSPAAFGYIAGGAGGETTMANNRRALDDWQIIPRMLRDISRRDISTELFGQRYTSPIVFGPVGVLGIAHPQAELAVAAAAKKLGIIQTCSTVSSHSLEAVAEANGSNPHWFQLYWGENHDLTRSLLSRAEATGYSAIVVTLDTPLLAWREKDIDNAYLPFLQEKGLENYYSDPVFRELVGEDPATNPAKAFSCFTRVFTGPSLTWEDLKVIRSHTSLPIILKGIQSVEDARIALEYGVDGILVSNHGGRQVDGAVGSFDVLGEIAHAVGDEATILFDSGIRRGADVFKAMALGASAVCVARPYAFALALGGARGVREWAANLLADTELTMALAGCSSWQEVSPDNLRQVQRN
ncbi:MAG: lactate 2-monooxygenase [Neolewinella sp.]|jgi:isopentenyl diphosphate isomerase/L-lactate dehydrogenase-like FMN-dependent dehydrogenase